MATVILHVGDTVTHTTLGEGVVTIVDEEFVTIKFATKELTFRLPDAFQHGFLTSEDAEIIGSLNDDQEDDDDEDEDEDDDEDDDDEEDEEDEDDDDDDKIIVNKWEAKQPEVTPEPKKESPGCLVSAISVIVPLVVVGPFIFLFGYFYSEGVGDIFLFLTIFGVLFYILVVFICMKTIDNPGSTSYHRPASRSSSNLGSVFWRSAFRPRKSSLRGMYRDTERKWKNSVNWQKTTRRKKNGW